jgi:hypothetical protein
MDIEALLGHMDIEAFLGHMEIGAKCQEWYSWDTIPFATQIWSFGTGGLLKESYWLGSFFTFYYLTLLLLCIIFQSPLCVHYLYNMIV